MEMVWIIVAGLLLFAGLLGCILPILPGPPLSYVGLLIMQLRHDPPFQLKFLLIWGGITLFVTVLDLAIPAYGTKRLGGSRKGIWGSVIGLLIGLIFFPPFGIVIGPFLGALAGEFLAGKNQRQALKAALGSFLGFMVGTGLKLMVSGMLIYYYIINI